MAAASGYTDLREKLKSMTSRDNYKAAAAQAVAEAATEETEDGRFFERTACLQQKQF